MSWLPVVEQDLGQERFLTDEPNVLFAAGNFSKANVMIGVTTDEFSSPAVCELHPMSKTVKLLRFKFLAFIQSSNLTNLLNKNFDEIAPACFFFEENDHKSASVIAAILRKSYFPFDTIDIRSISNLNKIFADGLIGYGVHKFVNYTRNFTDVYYYKFSYVGRFSLLNYPNSEIPYGVHHADDIQYVFDAPYVGKTILLTDPESFIVERMTRIWERFAWTG